YDLVHTRRTRARDVAPGPARGKPARRGVPVGLVAGALAILLIPAVVGAGILAPAQQGLTTASVGGTPIDTSSLANIALADNAQTLACGKDFTTKETLPANATGSATFSVAWKTPAGSSPA